MQDRVAQPAPAEVRAVSHQLTIHSGWLPDGLVTVAVLELTHTNRRAGSTSKVISLRHFSRAEWDADPAGCIADEVTLLIAPSVGVR